MQELPAPRSPGFLTLQPLLKLLSSSAHHMMVLKHKGLIQILWKQAHALNGGGASQKRGRGDLWVVPCFLVPMHGDALTVRKTCRRAKR